MAVLLREQEVFPTKEILQIALGEAYGVLEELEKCLMQDEFDLAFNWDYSRELKSWRCKVCKGTNTIFWFSAWNGFFKTLFLFSEEQTKAVADLDIHERIKKDLSGAGKVTKMHSLYVDVDKKEQLTDLLKIIKLKKRQSDDIFGG